MAEQVVRPASISVDPETARVAFKKPGAQSEVSLDSPTGEESKTKEEINHTSPEPTTTAKCELNFSMISSLTHPVV